MMESKKEPIIVTIGKNFNKYRKNYDISMYKLSKRTKVSTHTIASFEKGKANITINTMLKLCDAIELKNISELFKE